MKRPILLLLALGTFYTALADTFVVTSNADSGPGTLREAIGLANANGNSVTDYINFNIADVSVTGRTIFLLNSLPDLSADIIIDATSQPGSKIGVSDAKIRITNPTGSGIECVFRIYNSSNIGIYGFHFDHLNTIPNSFNSANAVLIHNAQNIAVGAAGKGNYFTNLAIGLGNATAFNGWGLNRHISFKGNIVNLTEDGTGIISNSFVTAISLTNVKDMDIGGQLAGEGNYLSGRSDVMAYITTDTPAHINLGYMNIVNNRLGCNYQENTPLNCGSIYLQNSNSYNYSDTSVITITGNSYNSVAYTFSNPMQNFLKIEGKKGFLDIRGNRVGLLAGSAQYFFGIIYTGISIARCENGIIGGNNPADTNYIAGCGTGIGLGNNKNITVTKNSMFCNSKGIFAFSDQVTIPKTKIFNITDYNVAGTTLPKSKVEVFLTKICMDCKNGKTYLGFTTADASGNWTFTSPELLDGAVTATGTSPSGATGEFAVPEYELAGFIARSPTCNQNNGSLRGMKFISGTRYYWVKNYGTQADTTFAEDLENIGPGMYSFFVEQGKYCSIKYSIYISDNSPKINALYKSIVQPSCGLNNGKIMYHSLSGTYNKITWKDSLGNTVGNTADLVNAWPGVYKLVIMDTTYGCGDSTGYYTLVNQSGPSLNTGNVQVAAATCSNSNGCITGITATNTTGNLFIQWVDSLNKPVGNTYDIANLPPGKYRLKFKDNGGCDTIITSFYTIGDNGKISIDTAHKKVTAGKCTGPGGSIEQITVSGGETYQWLNATGNTAAGSTPDVFNLLPGSYLLQVSNHFGCSKTSPVIEVLPPAFSPIAVTGVSTRDALCAQSTGMVTVNAFSKDAGMYVFRWADSSTGQTIATGTALNKLNAGTYQLFATDSNGCEKNIFTAHISSIPAPVIDYTGMLQQQDHCNLQEGSITGLQVKGLTGPAVYAWYDQFNNVVANTLQLPRAPAGSYTLKITDAGICNIQSAPISISNKNDGLALPVYDNLVIPRYADAAIKIKNAAAGYYTLSYTANGATAAQQNNTGNFVVPKISNDTNVYIRRVSGDCISAVAVVNIKVVDKSYFAVPTAFTPNGDGRNEQLSVKVLGYIQLDYFRIFNRFGVQVFETHQVNDGWNGRWKGILQQPGGYVWIAAGKDINGRQVSDKGSFLLVR